MIILLLLLLLSVAGVVAALLVPTLGDLMLVAVPSALASLYLLIRGWAGKPGGKHPIVLDGSNVMHWKDDTPRLETLREVTDRLTALGFTPGVIFDANAGYKLDGKFQGEKDLARRLGLPRDRVMVVDKGNPADPIILTVARDLGARVVSNDRFRDWVEDFPELSEPDRVIRGGYRDGRLWLDVDGH